MAQATPQHNRPTARPTVRPMGRPKKLGNERRVARLEAQVTLAEKQFVREQAKLAGITEAEYIRRRALGERVAVRQSKADAQLVYEVNAIGVNLMQHLRDDRFGRGTRTEADWDRLYDRVSGILEKLVDALDD